MGREKLTGKQKPLITLEKDYHREEVIKSSSSIF